ncbi:arylsulfatase [Haloferula sp. A504]|uniref:arylsulfatase n=1 Tax=Haloferula sp. A504 TaxID=3373601 RepID=UPI0031C07170|nr:arylsulfatase [Verrucomicrobiaceae bacterium E54]
MIRFSAILFLIPVLAGWCFAQPNIVVFLSDDQGWGDLSSSGNQDLATPRIDSLAQQGVSFDRFYVCPVCSPTRAEFLTGRHHARGGVYSTSAGGERLDLDETILPEILKAAGYRTGAFGKWHNGMQGPYHPSARGFDEFYGFCSGHWGHYFDPMLDHNGRIVKGEGFCIDDFTKRAINFIEGSVKAGKPFFAYLPYNTPHSPMQVPDRFWERFKDRQLKSTAPGREVTDHQRCALAMCENLDWNVGRLLDQLDRLGVADDTIVVWFHDNGPNGFRWNGGMKGKKGSTNEGGVRSPLYVRWPASIKAGTRVPQIASARDLLPTLCELAGLDERSEKPLDGRSLAPLIRDPETAWPERILIQQWQNKVSARSQRFRLDAQGKLFDMVEDPGQSQPVNKQHPEVLARLGEAAEKHRREFLPGYRDDDRPFILTHPDLAITQLPARDAQATGGLKRSSIHPNCSYYLNWKDTGDALHWAGRVEAPGRYRATVWYAAREAGARMALRFKDESLEFTIAEAHDPPEVGKAEDHAPRSESYVKDFKPLVAGTLELSAGDGELRLEALEIPGGEALEFRLLTLERLDPAER